MHSGKTGLSQAMRIYVAAVIAAGALVFTVSVPREYAQPALAFTWLAAMLVVSLFKLRLPLGRGEATMSMAYVIDFAVLVTAGAGLAMVIAAAGVLVQCLVRVRRRQPWYRTAFSVAAVVLAVQTAGWVWSALGGTMAVPGLLTTIVPLALAAAAYFAVNTGLVAAAIAVSTSQAPVRTWQDDFARTAPALLVAAGAGIVLQLLLTREMYLLVPVAAVPLVMCHVAYAAWFRRLAEHMPAPAMT